MKKIPVSLMILIVVATSGCGYKVSGRYSGLPEHIKTIAVPVFANKTVKFRLEQIVTAAVKKELAERGRFRVTGDPAESDALLEGTVNSFSVISVGVRQDDAGASFHIMMNLSVRLTDLKNKKTLYYNPSFVVREEYLLSTRVVDFYPEEVPAMERAAQRFAASLASTILETF